MDQIANLRRIGEQNREYQKKVYLRSHIEDIAWLNGMVY